MYFSSLFLLPLFVILSEIRLTFSTNAKDNARVGRRPGSLHGRRGEMDEDFDISVVVDRRVPDDNRTPGHRDAALASLEILIAGQRTPQPTTPTLKSNRVTRRPLPPCLNGGIRLLGSFCYCPSKFMGRYCEIYRFNSSCGRIPHGRWVYLNCNSCHCVAGVLKCQPHPMPGCDISSEEQTTVSPVGVDLLPDDDVVQEYNSATRRLLSSRTIISSLLMMTFLSHLLIRTPLR